MSKPDTSPGIDLTEINANMEASVKVDSMTMGTVGIDEETQALTPKSSEKGTGSGGSSTSGFWTKKTKIIVAVTAVILVAAAIVVVVVLTLPGDEEQVCDIPSFARRIDASKNSVFNSMAAWGSTPAKAANNKAVASMYMQNNLMTMTDTDFSTTINSGGRRSVTRLDRRAARRRCRAPQPAPPPNKYIRSKGWSAGAKFDFNMYMNENQMSMFNSNIAWNGATNSRAELTIKSRNFNTPVYQRNVNVRRRKNNNIVTSSSDYNLYMAENTLSMQTTTFTMNVGNGAGGRRMSAGVTTLNINMYMCHNTMSMTNTDFAMNIKGGSSDSSLATDSISDLTSGNDKSTDIAQLLPLIIAGIEGSRRGGSMNIFSWIRSAAATTNTLTLNMHMYKNDMSMTDTTFRFNVGDGAGGRRSYTFVNGTTTANSEEAFNDNDDDDFFHQRPNMTAGRRAPAKNKYIDKSSKTMTNTVFTMNVGSGAGGRRSDRRSGNTMSMDKLNIKMYMYDNEMSMKTTTFAWTIG